MSHRFLLALLLLASAPAALFAADTKPAEKADGVQRHALRGVITAVLADKSAFMIKHEAIPGVMRAMTMMFKVDAATLKAFKVGDAITGMMSSGETGWVLDDVKAATPPVK
jgi:Cu/Ag efflux protein CusF